MTDSHDGGDGKDTAAEKAKKLARGRSRHPQMDNVIYANFGAKTDVSVGRRASKSSGHDDLGRLNATARRFYERALDSVDDARLRRGREYHRNGNVLNVEVAPSKVTCQIAGSQNQPFTVVATLPYRASADLNEMYDHLARTTNSLKKLRAGDLDGQTLDILVAESDDTIRLSCDCPDQRRVNVCKHGVAAALEIAQRLNRDPAMILDLRGLRLNVLEELVSSRAQKIAEEESTTTSEGFWAGRDLPDLPTPKKAPAIDDSDLDALHKAMRMVSYTTIEQLRAVADIEDLYDELTRENFGD